MNKYIKKNMNNIISIFILLSPILDLLTGICIHTLKINFTIGIIVRVLFLLFITIITIFIFKKKKLIIPYLIIGLYAVLYIVGIIVYKNGVGLFTEIQGLVKVFYFPIILLSLYSLRDKLNISINSLFIVFYTYLLLILIPTLFGVGYKTYEITKAGTLGFFNSANEISGILSILTPIVLAKLLKSKNYIISIVLFLIYLVVILMVGTKTPLLSLCFTIGASIFIFFIGDIKEKKYKRIGILSLIIVIISVPLIIFLPKTNFYKNIETHLEFLEVENITDIFKDKKLIDHFIFSQRLTFLNNENKLYQKSSLYQKTFGRGYLLEGRETKMIEMDYFDIFYHHGIVGFIVYFSIVIYVVSKCYKKKEKTYNNYMLKLSFLLIVILSFFTGHIITAPAVSIIVVMIILGLYKKELDFNKKIKGML